MAVNAIGIDFGTSKCVTTWFDERTGRAELIRSAEGEDATPSLVYIGESETLIGKSAREMLDDEAERANVIGSVKSELAAKKRYAVPGRPTPVAVAAKLFGKLKADAEAGHFHASVTHAVITHPANFDAVRCERLRQAATDAGFAEVELLPEPVSAAIAYAKVGVHAGDTVLVYDLGAGTFDLALLTRDETDGSGFRVALPPVGRSFGGDNLDAALYDHCETIARATLGRPICLTDGARDLRFLMDCRQRKENLSGREKATFSSYLRGANGTAPVLFRHEITRADFESMVIAELEGTVRATRTLLGEAKSIGIAPESVLLIGGSSRVPLVARLLEDALPIKASAWEKRDIAVALGAAYHAHALWTAQSVAATVAPKARAPLTPAQTAQLVGLETAARVHYKAGRFPDARVLLEQGYTLDPQHEKILQMLGACYSLTGSTDAGIAAFGELSRAYSDNAYYWQNLGKALEIGNRHDEAVTAYRAAVRLGSHTRAGADLQALLQKLAEERGKSHAPPVVKQATSAPPVVEQAVSAPPVVTAPPVVHAPPVVTAPPPVASDINRAADEHARGMAHLERGEYADAERCLTLAAQSVAPGRGFTIYRALGDALAGQGKYPGAVAAYETCVSLAKSPLGIAETIPVMLSLSAVLCLCDRYPDAELVAGNVHKRNPYRADVLATLGVALSGQPAKHKEAIRVLNDCLSRDPGNIKALTALGRVFLQNGQAATGIGFLERAVRIRPQDALLAAELGTAFLHTGNPAKAAEVLHTAERVGDAPALRELRRQIERTGAKPAPNAGTVSLRVVVPPVPVSDAALSVAGFVGETSLGEASLQTGFDESITLPTGQYVLRLDCGGHTLKQTLGLTDPGAFLFTVPYLPRIGDFGKIDFVTEVTA